jgi:hypothetical protein
MKTVDKKYYLGNMQDWAKYITICRILEKQFEIQDFYHICLDNSKQYKT